MLSSVYNSSSDLCVGSESNIVSVYGYVFFFQAEDGIRDLVRSRGLGDVYKRQVVQIVCPNHCAAQSIFSHPHHRHC